MKQVLLKAANVVEVAETAAPEVPPGGVLLEMKAAALCPTDVKMIRRGHRDLVLPRIPGHEGVGEIVAGDHPALPVGTTVAVYPGYCCGICRNCRRGHTARCPSLSIYGFNRDGLFRTMLPFTEAELPALIPCAPNLSPPVAVFAEPLACCLAALRKFPGVERGVALVVGAGAVGCLMAAILVASAWKRVIIADCDPDRLVAEVPPGVETMAGGSLDFSKLISEGGIAGSIDLIIPACPGGLDWPFWEVMAPGGGIAVFSGLAGEGCREVALNRLHYGELTLTGSYGCNRRDFIDALGLLDRGSVELSFLKPTMISLAEIMDGVALLENRRAKKVLIDRF